RVDDEAVRGDPGLAQRGERPVEPPSGRCAPRVLVDHVAARRRVHGREHRDQVVAGVSLPAHRVEQLVAGHRLVRDDEDVAQLRTVSSSGTGAPSKIACWAPGTPYSYGPPTTCGTVSKLKIGGGDETCHSIVSARQGFAGAGSPRAQETIMLYRKTSVEAPRKKDAIEMKKFRSAKRGA